MAEQAEMTNLVPEEPFIGDDVESVPLRHVEETDDMPSAGLVGSVTRWGVIEPVILAIYEGRYRILDGRRRVAAARRAGYKVVPARVLTGTRNPNAALTGDVVTLMMNQNRSDNPAHELAAIERLMDSGATESQIASETGMRVQTIRRRLRLRRLSPPLRRALDEGIIGAGVAEGAASLSTIGQEALEEALEANSRLTAKDVNAAKQVRRAGHMAALDPSVFGPVVDEGRVERLLSSVIAEARQSGVGIVGFRAIVDRCWGEAP